MSMQEIANLPITDPYDSTVGEVIGKENMKRIGEIIHDLRYEAGLVEQLDLIRRLRSSYGYGAFGRSLLNRERRLKRELQTHYELKEKS